MTYYVAMTLCKWEKAKVFIDSELVAFRNGVTYEGGSVGYLLVYRTREEAERQHPGIDVVEIYHPEPTTQPGKIAKGRKRK